MKVFIGLWLLAIGVSVLVIGVSAIRQGLQKTQDPIGLYYGLAYDGTILWASIELPLRSIPGAIDAEELMKETTRIQYRAEIEK